MSDTYDGDPNNYPTSLTVLEDGDQPTEAAWLPAVEGLADRTENLRIGDTQLEGDKVLDGSLNVIGPLVITDGPISLTNIPGATTTKRINVWYAPLAATALYARLFTRSLDASPVYNAGIEWTVNANWNGTQWEADDTSKIAYQYEFFNSVGSSGVWTGGDGLLVIRTKASTGSDWNENAWDSVTLCIGTGNPAATASGIPKNLLCSKSVKKAWGKVTISGGNGTVTVNSGFGLSSVQVNSGTLLVTLRNAMSDEHYCPVATAHSATAIAYVEAVDDDQFRIGFRDYAGGALDPATVNVVVTFTVDGEHV